MYARIRRAAIFAMLSLYAGSACADFLQHDLEAYCRSYAQAVPVALLQQSDSYYIEGSAKIAQLMNISRWLSNLFQPPDSRFYAGYKCRFSIQQQDRTTAASVQLLLANTQIYANHTQWEHIQIIPIKAIDDTDNGRTGYIVVKYLDGLKPQH